MAPDTEMTRSSHGNAAVREHVLTSLMLGRLRPGDRVASVRRLADITGLNRKTIHRAYGALAKEGLLDARPGAGTFVAQFSDQRRTQDALTRAVDRCRGEASTLGLSATAFADFLHLALNGGLKGLPLVVVECNREQTEMIRLDLEAGLGVHVRTVLFEDLAANPAAALAGARGIVTTYCHRVEVESLARTAGIPVYRVALDPEFLHRIARRAKSRSVVLVVGDDRFADVFRKFFVQLGVPPEVAARVRVVRPDRLRATMREAGDDAVVLVSRLVEQRVALDLPGTVRPQTSHWRLARGTVERLRAELAFDLAAGTDAER